MDKGLWLACANHVTRSCYLYWLPLSFHCHSQELCRLQVSTGPPASPFAVIRHLNRLVTLCSLCGRRLDFFMINKKWTNSALNCEVYSTFPTVGSDHRIVTAKIRLSLRASTTANKKGRYTWGMLLGDNNVINRYNLIDLITFSC